MRKLADLSLALLLATGMSAVVPAAPPRSAISDKVRIVTADPGAVAKPCRLAVRPPLRT